MKPYLRLERFPSLVGIEPGTARSAGPHFTKLTGLLTVFESALEGECLLPWEQVLSLTPGWKRTGHIDHGMIAST